LLDITNIWYKAYTNEFYLACEPVVLAKIAEQYSILMRLFDDVERWTGEV
jgi:hypothetical protein